MSQSSSGNTTSSANNTEVDNTVKVDNDIKSANVSATGNSTTAVNNISALNTNNNSTQRHQYKWLEMTLHLIVLALSILLIVIISIDTFHSLNYFTGPIFRQWQFWICMVFIAVFIIELVLAKRKWHYFYTNLGFLLVSIPYQSIILYFGWHLSDQADYLIRYMPLIRGGYAMALVVGWFTSNRATGLFLSYLITLLSTVYFGSLIFYLFEYPVNPMIENYSDSLWWALMDMTTVGSNITAVTGVGRILSVLLAALGMMMFPIFTVYVTNLINRTRKDGPNL